MLLLWLFSAHAFTQVGRPAIQLSGVFPTYSNKFSTVLSVYANAATASHAESVHAAVYKEQKFLMKDLGFLYATVVKPIPDGIVGIAVQHGGMNSFRETNFSVIYCKPLGKADLAAKFNYVHTKVEGFRANSALTMTIAGLFHFSDQFHSGFQIEHLNSVFSKPEKSRAPQADYKFGFGYDVSTLVHLSIECQMQQANSVNVNTGIAYQVHAKCRLFMGMGTFIPVPWFGVQFFASSWNIGMKSTYHRQLGITPALWISFKKDKTE